MAFGRDFSLPASVVGPVLSRAFLRLASICLKDVIFPPTKELALLRYFETLGVAHNRPDI